MELRQLRYFVAVAEELSFTRAAARLHMAQPPLSQQIAGFESELGLSLFHRTTRRIELTSLGRELLPEARAIVDSVERFSQRTEARRRGELGELKLSVISGLATSELAELLRGFRAENPGLKVSLEVHPSVWQLQAFRDSTLDAGFLSLPEQELMGLGAIRVLEGRMSLAVPKDHPLASKDRASWNDLDGQPMIWVEAGSIVGDYYSGLRKRCRQAGFEPQVTQYAPNGATQVWMVSAGLGIAPIHVTPKRHEWPGVRFLALPDDAPRHEVYFAWKKGAISPGLERFIAFVEGRLTANPTASETAP
jgi:DNA-binding transcriptional LysR family regulator